MKIHNVAFIPARGGSKRMPGKNKAMLRPGITLAGWSVIQAVRMALFSTVVVSTDDDEIWNGVVQSLKHVGHVHPRTCASVHDTRYLVNKDIDVVRHRRPDSLATSKSNVWSAVDHWLNARTLAADSPNIRMIVLLQPTNPFRTMDTIHKVMLACKPSTPEVFTAHHPKFITDMGGVGIGIDPEGLIIPNGNAYASLLKTVNNRLQRVAVSYTARRKAIITELAFEQIDIDTRAEYLIAKALADYTLNFPSSNYTQLIRGDTF